MNICGICGQRDETKSFLRERGGLHHWSHPEGNLAHGVCIERFKPIEAIFQKNLKHFFPGDLPENENFRNLIHALGIKVISDSIENGEKEKNRTLSYYLQKCGEERLSAYFDIVGTAYLVSVKTKIPDNADAKL